MFTTGPAYWHTVIAGGGGPDPGGDCPDYSTVTLRETVSYTAPGPTAADLAELACPYTPPTPI